MIERAGRPPTTHHVNVIVIRYTEPEVRPPPAPVTASLCSAHQDPIADCDMCNAQVNVDDSWGALPSTNIEPPAAPIVAAFATIGAQSIVVGAPDQDAALTKMTAKLLATAGDGIPVEMAVTDGGTLTEPPPTWRVLAEVTYGAPDDPADTDVTASVTFGDFHPTCVAADLVGALDGLRATLIEHFDDGLPVIVEVEPPPMLSALTQLPPAVWTTPPTPPLLIDPPYNPSPHLHLHSDTQPTETFHVTVHIPPSTPVGDVGGVADPLGGLPSGMREYPRLTADGDDDAIVLSLVMMTTPKRTMLARCAWECILRQVGIFVPFEVVIVCDLAPGEAAHGHFDDVYATHGGQPFRVRRIHQNFDNMTAKLQTALDEAKGRWIVMWDDDDWSSPNRLAETLTVIDGLDELNSGVEVDFISPPTIYRHEILKTGERRTFTYTAPGTLKKRREERRPIPGCMAFRRLLYVNDRVEALPGTRPHHHELGHWSMRRILDDESRVAPLTGVTIVGIVHGGNMNAPRPLRVAADGKVLDGDEFTLIGDDERDAAQLMGEDMVDAFKAAAATSWR